MNISKLLQELHERSKAEEWSSRPKRTVQNFVIGLLLIEHVPAALFYGG